MATETFVSQPSELELKLAVGQAAGEFLRAKSSCDERTIEQPIRPGRAHLISADIRFLSPLLKELGELRQGDDTDEYGTLKATKSAYDTACQLLIDAAIVAAPRCQIPRGCASTDSEGGVRVQWIRPDKSVHLVVPAESEGESYIYHEAGNAYGTEPASAEVLAAWLSEID